MLITVENEGPILKGSNYWSSDLAARGLFYLSINAGAFRLLVPAIHNSIIIEFKTAREVLISKGPWKQMRGREGVEIFFDDHSANPFSLHVDARQLDILPAPEDSAKEWPFTAWIQGKDGVPSCVYEHSCFYRKVPEIPWLRSR